MKLSLAEIIQMLSTADRSGMPTDDPEGTRYVQLSDTLTRQITASLEAHQERTSSLEQQVQANATQAATAARHAIADKILAGEPWQSQDETLDAEFITEVQALAETAETDELAEQAVFAAVTKRQKLLAIAQNTPGIKPATNGPDAKAAKAIAQSRRHAGLIN